MRRGGRAEPIVGTTTMSATVHRDFLFEPNAAVWDETFGEIASLGMNAIRTGIWSGWRKISVDANVVDEGVVRALEAFYLTARKHQLPVIFSVFAFVPEDFGSGDPYFDPRALDGQRALLSAFARRLSPAREFIWDLINEPSFASPRDLWSLRPSALDPRAARIHGVARGAIHACPSRRRPPPGRTSCDVAGVCGPTRRSICRPTTISRTPGS